METISHVFNAINPISEVFLLAFGLFLFFTPLEKGPAGVLSSMAMGLASIAFSFWLTSNFVHEQFIWGGVWISLGFFATLLSPGERGFAIVPFIAGIIWGIFAYMRW